MTSTGSSRAVGVLIATASGGVIGLGLVYYLTVFTVRGREISDASLRGALSISPALQESVDAVLNVVSTGSLLGAMAVVAFIALLRLARLLGLAAIGLLVGANVSTWLLKNVLLVRPDLGLDEVAPATLNSLPSGHTTAAFSAVVALLIVMPPLSRGPLSFVGALFAAVTGLATMWAGWHRAADSVAAYLVVGVWAMLMIAGVIWLHSRERGVDASEVGRVPLVTRRSRWPAAVVVGAFVLGTASIVALSAAGGLRETLIGSLLAFAISSVLVIATVVAVTAGVLRGLELLDVQTRPV